MFTNIIMLMAGEGQRFKDGGYDIPKPYIIHEGKEIFRWATGPFINQPNCSMYFATRSFHREYQQEWMRNSPKVVQFNSLTRGALETALIAAEKIGLRDCDPVIFTDCDIWWDLPEYFDIHKSLHNINKGDFASILYNPINTTENKWMYLVGAERGYINNYYDIREKDSSRGGYPAIGVYYFSSLGFFRRLAKNIMNKDSQLTKELYLSTALTETLLSNNPAFTIPVKDFRSLGVPADLK